MLSASELTAMRNTLAESLPDSGTISRLSLTSDGMGGGTPTWANVGTASCRVAPWGQKSPDEAIIAERVGAVAYWSITFGQGTDVTAKDRIATGDHTYEVIGARAPHSWELSRRCMCVEVT